MQTERAEIAATVVGVRDNTVRLAFEAATLADQETITRALYSRADSWLSSGDVEVDRPLVSLARVIRPSFTGFHQVIRSLLTQKRLPKTAPTQIATATHLLLLIGMCLPAYLHGQSRIPNKEGSVDAVVSRDKSERAEHKRSLDPSHGLTGIPAARETLSPRPVAPDSVTYNISFKDMGAQKEFGMHGPHSFYSVGFTVGHSLVPRNATLNLSYHFSRDLLRYTGAIAVSLNEVRIAEISAPDTRRGMTSLRSSLLPSRPTR